MCEHNWLISPVGNCAHPFDAPAAFLFYPDPLGMIAAADMERIFFILYAGLFVMPALEGGVARHGQ